MKMKGLFENKEGHLTDFALNQLVSGELDEMGRLEVAEHLAFCDHCLERYTAVLDGRPLMETPDLFGPSVMRALRRKVLRITASRYFTAAISACIALVFWVTGIFNVSALRPDQEKTQQAAQDAAKPRFSIAQAAGDMFDSWANSLSNLVDSIDLRGVFYNEKK